MDSGGQGCLHPADEDAHFMVAVHAENPLVQPEDQRPSVHDDRLFGGGGAAEMDARDPQTRRIGNSVVATERARIEALLPQPGVRVDMTAPEPRVDGPDLARLRTLADGLAQSKRYPSTPQLPVETLGWAQEPTQFEAAQRGAAAVADVFGRLAPGRVAGHDGWGHTEPGVVQLRIAELELQQAKEPEFSFAAHETGHMLGLGDETEEPSPARAPTCTSSPRRPAWRRPTPTETPRVSCRGGWTYCLRTTLPSGRCSVG